MPEYNKAESHALYSHIRNAYNELEAVKGIMSEADYNYIGFKKLLTQVGGYVNQYKAVYADHLIIEQEESE